MCVFAGGRMYLLHPGQAMISGHSCPRGFCCLTLTGDAAND
ncbi:hypothetical protein LHK_00764 [Laribacter hongkongensis HLHK9]|uniref:Uncharacterized protein n=2 Tax=Laribacter hongkongensis TaxID=168471 RepID=C1D4G3_LARHH|nr:hypothetical protein LHK_00764 [Laribacter hongkongensis HLHK9]ASJ23588.1 hypothetical protein LHGZ1_0757 [Laribacter hongkongensis]